MTQKSRISNAVCGFFRTNTEKPLSLVAKRFLQVFHEHGVEAPQIPRLLSKVALSDLQSHEQLLKILTPDLLDQVAKLFGIRSAYLGNMAARSRNTYS